MGDNQVDNILFGIYTAGSGTLEFIDHIWVIRSKQKKHFETVYRSPAVKG